MAAKILFFGIGMMSRFSLIDMLRFPCGERSGVCYVNRGGMQQLPICNTYSRRT